MEDHDGPLPADWEAVQDDLGRTYFWNVETNEVSWERPKQVTATKSVAANYLAGVQHKATPSSSTATDELNGIRQGAAIANLTKQFSDCSANSAGPSPSSPAAHATQDLGGRSKVMSVDALKKYSEAKRQLAESAGSPPARSPPPKVDLYK